MREMEDLKYYKAKKIFLKSLNLSEIWLQEKISEDPNILGLGNLELIRKERKQSSGGRIDFLFRNADTDTFYEVEVQLGKTDESHIIRTIEYWDIERRKNPSYDHRAVIIAEDITNRFFNVVYLMNRSIPIIAIQLNSLIVEDKIILDFTTVLDIYEEQDNEIDLLNDETVSEESWIRKVGSNSMEIAKSLIQMAKEIDNDIKHKFTIYRIPIETSKGQCIWIRPRVNDFNRVTIKVNESKAESVKSQLERLGIFMKMKDYSGFVKIDFNLTKDQLDQHKDFIRNIFQQTLASFS